MRFLVFQHIDIEHPGIFRDFMAADGVAWDAIELDEGQPIPSLDGYDALIVMGGPMDVWEVDDHPWLVAEKAAIREAVSVRRMPYLGICLGHQLLADALGGNCAPMTVPEVGILEAEVTESGKRDPLFAGMPAVGRCLQWHSVEVSTPPPGSEILAQSPACDVQAIRVGEHAYGIQYHVELTDRTVAEWGEVPAYIEALKRTIGEDALPQFEADAAANMAAFNRNAKRLYDNFMRVVQRQPVSVK